MQVAFYNTQLVRVILLRSSLNIKVTFLEKWPFADISVSQTHLAFLAPSAGLCHGHVSVHACVHGLLFQTSFFLKCQSNFDKPSQKCSWNGPLQKLSKEFDFYQNSCCYGSKSEKI